MDDEVKVWTTVGSAGTLNQTDLAKVSLHQSVIQLGVDIVPPLAVSTQAAAPQVASGAGHLAGHWGPTMQAIVRYNVTPVDGLLIGIPRNNYELRIRFRGQITAKLMEVDMENGTETQRILFDSNSFPPNPNFQVQSAWEEDSAVMDFVNKAYYVEATLVASAVVVGHSAAISVIKILSSPPLH
jgi:hypothetical protein